MWKCVWLFQLTNHFANSWSYKIEKNPCYSCYSVQILLIRFHETREWWIRWNIFHMERKTLVPFVVYLGSCTIRICYFVGFGELIYIYTNVMYGPSQTSIPLVQINMIVYIDLVHWVLVNQQCKQVLQEI